MEEWEEMLSLKRKVNQVDKIGKVSKECLGTQAFLYKCHSLVSCGIRDKLKE
jgi:hypothetical protein